ncbi:hypothetical protein NI473_14855 [Escherichia coli]|nr:hypothetical protein [Escherichia coli]
MDGVDVHCGCRKFCPVGRRGKDLVGVLFGSIFLWVIIGVAPVAVAKMAWRFVS